MDTLITEFDAGLVSCLNDAALLDGNGQLLDANPAWEGKGSHKTFIAFTRTGPGGLRRLMVVNNTTHRTRCYLTLPWEDLAGRPWRFHGRLGSAVYYRDGEDLSTRVTFSMHRRGDTIPLRCRLNDLILRGGHREGRRWYKTQMEV